MNNAPLDQKEVIRSELESTQVAFHSLLNSLSARDLHKISRNPGWTNEEILAHMVFGLIILRALLPIVRFWGRFPRGVLKPFAGLLNAFTTPFNWINALGARLQARVFTYPRIGTWYDRIDRSLMKQMDSIDADEWERGIYYPTRWDANFSDFMTIADLFHYIIDHFNFHAKQISQDLPMVE